MKNLITITAILLLTACGSSEKQTHTIKYEDKCQRDWCIPSINYDRNKQVDNSKYKGQTTSFGAPVGEFEYTGGYHYGNGIQYENGVSVKANFVANYGAIWVTPGSDDPNQYASISAAFEIDPRTGSMKPEAKRRQSHNFYDYLFHKATGKFSEKIVEGKLIQLSLDEIKAIRTHNWTQQKDIKELFFSAKWIDPEPPALPQGLFTYEITEFSDPRVVEVNVLADFENSVGFIDFYNPTTAYDLRSRPEPFRRSFQIRDHFQFDMKTGAISNIPATAQADDGNSLIWTRTVHPIKNRQRPSGLAGITYTGHLYGNDAIDINGTITQDIFEGNVNTVSEPIYNQYPLKEFSFEFSGTGRKYEEKE